MKRYIFEILDTRTMTGYYVFKTDTSYVCGIEFDRCNPEEGKDYNSTLPNKEYYDDIRQAINDIRLQTGNDTTNFWANMICLDPEAPFLSARQSVVRRWFVTYDPKDKSAKFMCHT